MELTAINPKEKTDVKFNFLKKGNEGDKIVAIAGNPNVGKSTIFNGLTGMNQHTGNWPGKTVSSARGHYKHKDKNFMLVDIPGTYSLIANSQEEEIARDFICFEKTDAVIVVIDATCMERTLNLALQILEITRKVVVCVNLIDEAKKKQIEINLDELTLNLGVPVVATSARNGDGLNELMDEVYNVVYDKTKVYNCKTNYGSLIEESILKIENALPHQIKNSIDSRWLSLRLLSIDNNLLKSVHRYLGYRVEENFEVYKSLKIETDKIYDYSKDKNYIKDQIVYKLVQRARSIYKESVNLKNEHYDKKDRLTDKILTSKTTGIPIMLFMLMVIFWITIVGANYPSEMISSVLFAFEAKLNDFFVSMNSPDWVSGILVFGVYRTLAWVVSVMLPPMAIFFPIFTLLEDVGYLPRIAFNMDKLFKISGAHGKQALTMCMGFGCNACGIMGCRIIDSPREKLIAILTNNFVPCNGRFPALIAIITMFFVGYVAYPFKSFACAGLLTCIILFGIFMTFIVSYMLSKTLLRGMPSSFILELPPYRSPQIGKVLVRSIFDRTVFVLARAVVVAAPAGLIIWVLANTYTNSTSILSQFCALMDPLARFMGLDGVILVAFILGFPANEIVIPIIIMSYMNTGNILSIENLNELRNLFVANGWTPVTAICTMVFSLFHFPCGTTCLTIKKETASLKWTLLSIIIPTIIGAAVCSLISGLSKIIL